MSYINGSSDENVLGHSNDENLVCKIYGHWRMPCRPRVVYQAFFFQLYVLSATANACCSNSSVTNANTLAKVDITTRAEPIQAFRPEWRQQGICTTS